MIRFCHVNSKIGEVGWQSRPLSPWADGFREALFRWGEAQGLQGNDLLFPSGSTELEQRFLEVLAPTLWRKCRLACVA